MHGRTPGRALVAGGVGNVVEWYDFAVYGAFDTVIATTYFPGADPIAGLSASFAVFATAFLARPVGAVLFGRLGDRVGRRQVLVTVIVLMAAATAAIGLLPGHAAIGVLAPVLLVVFRAAQGLSVGGEAAGATAFVVEYAPEGRRGWYGSWLWSTLAIGVAGGIGVAVLLARVFPREVLEDRGWRLAFLVALPLGLVGLYLRLRLDETPRFQAVARADGIVRRPVAVTLRAYPGRLLLGLAPVAAASLTFNLYFFYLPSYLATRPRGPPVQDARRRPGRPGRRGGPGPALRPAVGPGRPPAAARRRDGRPGPGRPAGVPPHPWGGAGRPGPRLPPGGAAAGQPGRRPGVPGRAVPHPGPLDRPGHQLRAGDRAVRGHGAVPGHRAGAPDRQPGRSRHLRRRRRRRGGGRGRGGQGDRVPAAGHRRPARGGAGPARTLALHPFRAMRPGPGEGSMDP
jgi:MFS family permease